jgi:hypothetical protein
VLWLTPALFGFACLLTIASSLLSGDRANFGAAVGALAVWALANMLWLNNHLVLMPLLDWGLGLAALVAWLEHRSQWAGRVVLICYLRLALHVIDQMTAQTFFVGYAHALNGLFAALLWSIAEPGGRNGARRIRDFWRSRHRRRSPAPAYREAST